MFANTVLDRLMDSVDGSPWGAATGRHVRTSTFASFALPRRGDTFALPQRGDTFALPQRGDSFTLPRRGDSPAGAGRKPLYTPEEKRRRDASPWTVVQGVLAPVQFAVFAVSLALVLHYLTTGAGVQAATASVVIKTLVLYTIMVTGAVWENAVFGRYLFAPAFFWEDAVSMVVIGLHTAYLAALLSGALDSRALMLLALAAYATYMLNAAQFVMKLRAARRAEQDPWHQAARGMRRAG